MVDQEYFQISCELEEHHVLFYTMWGLGKPVFTNKVDRAAVSFNEEGAYIEFLFNPDFWEQLDQYNRLFVISHECLHVILNHGLRIRDADNTRLCNLALDVVVNHMLVNKFGFDRSLIQDQDKLCWTDTVLPQYPEIEDNDCFEHYYKLLLESQDEDRSSLKFPDEHGYMSESDWEEVLEQTSQSMPNGEQKVVDEQIQKHGCTWDGCEDKLKAGTGSVGGWKFVDVGRIRKKHKWETVIYKWASKYKVDDLNDCEQWARTNRRFTTLSHDLMLPTDMDDDVKNLPKIDVWFFQDTSGSCSQFLKRFFKAAMSLNKRRFNVHMHCFDTEVYKTDLQSKKLYGFGGTAYHPIEEFIQKEIQKSQQEYPKAVFVITDGHGSQVNPQHPANWYWFLSNDYKQYIPKDSHIFNLKDFE